MQAQIIAFQSTIYEEGRQDDICSKKVSKDNV